MADGTTPDAGATPDAEHYQALTPYLIVKDAARAIAFYQQVFGATELTRLTGPDGKIGHAELLIVDSWMMLADEHPDFGALSPPAIGGSPVNLHLYVDDVDRCVAGAVAAGATLLRPVEDKVYGDRSGMIADPFGHKWFLATRQRDVSHAEVQAHYTATFKS